MLELNVYINNSFFTSPASARVHIVASFACSVMIVCTSRFRIIIIKMKDFLQTQVFYNSGLTICYKKTVIFSCTTLIAGLVDFMH